VRWLALALLLATRTDEGRAVNALRALAARELADAAGLAAADPAEVAARLAREGVARPEATAALLLRACRTFAERWQGSVARIAADADDLADLGARVAGLASGLGAATVARFLRPLRERFPAAREVPLAASARAAARHLGWIAEGDDEEGEPAVLRKWLAQTPDAPPFPDLEAALERLGSAACLRGRSARCPLGEACPLRAGAHPVSSADGFD
jgi:hypothetical protein